MFPIINIGPLAIQAPGLIILMGIYLSFMALEKYSAKFNLSSEIISNIVFTSLISAVIFARIAYVFQYPTIFVKNPLTILSINLSFFDPLSGLVFALLFLFIRIRKKELDVLSVLDNLTPGLSIFLTFCFFSLIASGKYYGFGTDLPWGIFLWGTIRHPLQLYFLIGSLLVNFIVWQLLKNKIAEGKTFFMFLSIQSVEFIFLDYFRGDGNFQLGNLHLMQLFALGFLFLSIFFLKLISRKELRNKY
jgi:prolipoprotein diacylglyceryltransferase